ncbi:hypothetical protein, variant [Verruconis gallopava]|uniref:DH domain-containing protein n=1 Tax=Verruconis gallopava TaxID=253628 RepID=A0A0D1YN87_9PEZI|nr:hypothetical protein, variant [Verruconis gallopava]KIW02212.1 hypothetical protein, variant [Verruconis gallopava]
MDPLTVTVSVASFLANCLTTVKVLGSLSSRYPHVLVTISSIVTETTYLGSFLGHIQELLLINAPSVHDTSPAGRELRQTFDLALSACLITFGCLEEEVRQLAIQPPPDAGPEWKERVKQLWKDDIMNEILTQIREQQSTMALLVQTLQMPSLSASNHFLKENRGLLVATVSRSRALRQASYANLKVPESIFEGRNSALVESGSIVGSSEFDFDDDVVNSTVYRRANVQRYRSQRVRAKHVGDADTDEYYDPAIGTTATDHGAQSSQKETRASSRMANMETVAEELEDMALDRKPRKWSGQRHGNGSSDNTVRPQRLNQSQRFSDDEGNLLSHDASAQSRFDSGSHRSPDLSASSSFRSPDTSASDISGPVVNFSHSLNDFYDDSSGHFAPIADREPAQIVPITRYAPSAAKRVEALSQEANARRGIPSKAAKRLGVDDRQQPSRLGNIDEIPTRDRPSSSTSGGSGSSRGRPSRPVTQVTLAELSRQGTLDFTSPWSVFWHVTPEEIRKPPRGYSVAIQELWWKLLQFEESYTYSLQMVHTLITSDTMLMPKCGITPASVQKLQASHDKHIRQPLRDAMSVGPWTFEYATIIKAYQLAHAHLASQYERYAWDLPLVTYSLASASAPASATSRDLLLSLGPGMPTRYTCLRSPLTHLCSTFDTIQSIYDITHNGGPKDVPNFAQLVYPVREQLRSLIASCNRNILLQWEDLRRVNLFGDQGSRDIADVTKELVFPPSQRRNMMLLNLSSPTRSVILRADLHWKASIKDNWSKCHAVLLNNYVVLSGTSPGKGQRQHQVYFVVSLAEIATTTMSAEPLDDKKTIKLAKAGKPMYHLTIRTPDFEHILGFGTMVQCLEWHEHLDVALRGEMMDMPTGISSNSV